MAATNLCTVCRKAQHLDGDIFEFTEVGAGIHDHPAANRTGDTTEEFDASEAALGRFAEQLAGADARFNENRCAWIVRRGSKN